MADKLKKIGPFDVVEVNPNRGTAHGPCIVMFHGFGADCFDLTPFSQVVKVPKNTSWYFPNGPIQVPVGPGFSGRAWYNIDIQALENAMRHGKHRDMRNTNPPGLDKAKLMAHEFLQSLDRKPEDIILGGFSQGAILATDLALSSTSQYRGLVILSGTIVRYDEWKKLAPLHKGLRFFQSHGVNDALLDPKAAEDLEKLLLESGLEGQLEMFRGGHEIPPNTIKSLSSFLLDLA